MKSLEYSWSSVLFAMASLEEGVSIAISPVFDITPVLNSTEEICPSPVALKLRIKRTSPLSRLSWLGCLTIEGLNKAADSTEYSFVK